MISLTTSKYGHHMIGLWHDGHLLLWVRLRVINLIANYIVVHHHGQCFQLSWHLNKRRYVFIKTIEGLTNFNLGLAHSGSWLFIIKTK